MNDNKNKKIIFLDDTMKGGEDTMKGGEDTSSDSSSYYKQPMKVNEEVPHQEVEVSLNGGEDTHYDDVSVSSDLISEGGVSSASSYSSGSSVNTAQLLSVDPMYIRLTKFLETNIKLDGGANKKVNVTDLLSEISSSLKDIKVTFKEMSSVLQKMAINNTS